MAAHVKVDVADEERGEDGEPRVPPGARAMTAFKRDSFGGLALSI